MPLPWALDHVHCYALASPDGWTLVDALAGTRQTVAWWEEVPGGAGPPGRDPASCSPTTTRTTWVRAPGSRSSRAPRRSCRGGSTGPLAVAGGRRATTPDYERYPRPTACRPTLAAASTRAEDRRRRRARRPHPPRGRGRRRRCGRTALARAGAAGHADGHIALHDEGGGRLIGGDVLLDEITPNVGRWPDTAPDPLGRYLATLRRVADLAPAVVYPGHGSAHPHPALGPGGRDRGPPRRAPRGGPPAALAEGAESRLRRRAGDLARRAAGVPRAAVRARRGDLDLERLAATGRAVEHRPARWRAAG